MVPWLKHQHFYVCVYVLGLKERKGIKRDGNRRQQSPLAFRDEFSAVWRQKKTSKLKSSLSKNVQHCGFREINLQFWNQYQTYLLLILLISENK